MTQRRIFIILSVVGAVVAIWLAGFVTVQVLSTGCRSGNELRATMRAMLRDAQAFPQDRPITAEQQKQIDAYFARQYERLAPRHCPRFFF